MRDLASQKHFLKVQENRDENYKEFIETIYSGRFASNHPIQRQIDQFQKIEMQMKHVADFLNLMNHPQDCESRQFLRNANLHLAMAKLKYREIKPLKGRKAFLIHGNLILNNELSPIFGSLTLLLASFCPILLARKVKKLATYMRILKKVLQKTFALILIYANIITLFKNLLVYHLYKNSQVFQQNTGYVSAYSKTIGKTKKNNIRTIPIRTFISISISI